MKNKILLFLITITLCFGFFVAKEVKAAESDNVWGWAWSENIGWIKFNNCTDPSDSSTCEPISYGVDIDPNTGLFSGYAWSENIGWISFNDFDGSHPQAQLNLNNGEVSGWARALAPVGQPLSVSGGWDGWIKLSGSWADGVSLNFTPDPSEFEGWAWGSDVVGWVSFNRSNTGAAVDYKVMTDININPPPSASNLGATEGNYCNCAPGQTTQCSGSKSQPPIYLNWTFDDPRDSQTAYQIQIDNSGTGFPSPEIDTGKVTSSSESYAPLNLSFGATYYWRLKVWDSQGAESDWINAPASFSTDIRWPNTKFTPSLTNPPTGVEVAFTDESTCYSGAADCSDASYAWDFEYDGMFAPTYFFKEGAVKTYPESGDYVVRLEVLDITGSMMCPAVFPLTATLPLPTWKETVPF